ncbi:MASE1 domain-containing protein [Caldimonas tepidiphila]|uniref:MASE1 domain-containing protein n=1 Tax=Caldimonas tepidiphila TaxID=2315841 RepID=UPI00147679FB|nr:MASE1 domain-containing protein [Caldimonas tepidiphila]
MYWMKPHATLSAGRAFVLLLLAYLATAVFSLQWATVKGAGSPLWLPAGVGMAGLILGGVRLWPAIFLARLLAGYLSGSQLPFAAEVAIAAGNAASTVAGVWMLRGRDGEVPALDALRPMLRFLLGAALVSASLAATIGTVSLYFASDLAVNSLPRVWVRWMFSNTASVMVITGFVLARRQEGLQLRDWARLGLIVAAAAAASTLIFLTGPDVPLRTWHVYPILIWAALSAGTAGAAAALLTVDAFAIASVLVGLGPFVNIDPDPVGALFYLQQFLVLTAVTILLLSAVSDERKGKVELEAAQAELKRLNEELEARVQERTEALRHSERALLQAQKMEAVGRLTGGIAHDFNNLLQAIGTSFELIARDPGSAARVEKYAATGKRATARGVRLTRQLLTFSRMQDLELQAIAPRRVIENMRELLRSTLGAGVELEFVFSGAENLHVRSDPTQLELMIINLAVNARDAMPEGGRLSIGIAEELVHGDPELDEGCYARLWVGDTGHGMSEDVASRAFDPFFTTKPVGKGTGLGLSMVYGVARQSGGKVRIASTPGEGTTVSVFLPCVEPAAAPAAPLVQEASPVPAGLDVLLVDDDELVRKSTSEILKALGCRVREAGDGHEALAQAARQPPEMVVLDYTMPGLKGSEVAGELRRRGQHMPVLLVTGDARGEDLQDELPQGVSLLRKPFEIPELRRALAAACAARDRSGPEDDGLSAAGHLRLPADTR